eukprot:1315100-Amorphochlora_amoeboformis.AAC.1
MDKPLLFRGPSQTPVTVEVWIMVRTKDRGGDSCVRGKDRKSEKTEGRARVGLMIVDFYV